MPRPAGTVVHELPEEFAHDRFRVLLGRGSVHGWVTADDVRSAMEATGTSMSRMKVVLRALENAGITVRAEPAD